MNNYRRPVYRFSIIQPSNIQQWSAAERAKKKEGQDEEDDEKEGREEDEEEEEEEDEGIEKRHQSTK